MSNISNQIEEAKEMLQEVETFIADKTKTDIISRLNSWSKISEVSGKAKSQLLPPLVMTSGGLPKPLNALYFKLKQ